MFKPSRRFFAPPVFAGDEDKTRRAEVLNAILWSLITVLAFSMVAVAFVFAAKLPSMLVVAGLLLALLVSRQVMHSGRIRLASLVLVAGTWLIVTMLVGLAGGMQSIDASYYIMVTVFAGLLLGTDVALFVVGLTAVTGLGMVWLENAGHLPRLFPLPPASGLANLTFALFLAAVALRLALRSLDKALAQARDELGERRQAEAALRASEEQFRLLAENSTDMISRHSPEGAYLYVSPACRRLLGYEPQDLLGHSAYEFIHPEDVARVAESQSALAQQLFVPPVSYRLRRRDRQYVWVESTVRTIADEATGAMSEIHAASRDVTERKHAEDLIQAQNQQLQAQNQQLHDQDQALLRAEAELRQMNAVLEQRVAERTAQLEETVKELEAFAYSISHDLRAPLRAVGGFAQVLEEDYAAKLPPDGAHLVSRVRAGAERMNKLIDDLLAFSRLGRKPLEKQAVDLAHLARQAVEDLRDNYGERVAEVALGALPPAEADSHLLHQVFVNLVGNGLKFTRRQPAPRVEVGCELQNGEPVYFVRDNGVGFDMAYAHRLFGVFQRLHSASEYEGTGVGLAIVQRIINRHGGRVWVQAAVGQGATFYFTLPGRKFETVV